MESRCFRFFLRGQRFHFLLNSRDPSTRNAKIFSRDSLQLWFFGRFPNSTNKSRTAKPYTFTNPMRLYGLKVKQFCMPFSFVFCSVGVFNWRPCAFSSCTDFSCQLTTKLSHISRFRDPKTPPKPNRRWKMLLGSEPTFPLEMLQISGSMIIFGGEWASASLSHLSSMFRVTPPHLWLLEDSHPGFHPEKIAVSASIRTKQFQ